MSLYIELANLVVDHVPKYIRTGIDLISKERTDDEGFIKCTQVALSIFEAISLYRGVEISPKFQKVLSSAGVLYSFDLLKLPNSLFGVINNSTVDRQSIFGQLEARLRNHYGYPIILPAQESSSVELADKNENNLRNKIKTLLNKTLSYNWKFSSAEDNEPGVCYTSVEDLKITLKRRLRDDLGLSEQEAGVVVNAMNISTLVPSILTRIFSIGFISDLSFNIVNVGSVIMQLEAWGADLSYYIEQIGQVKLFGFIKSIDIEMIGRVSRVSLIIGYASCFIKDCGTIINSTEWRKRESAMWGIFKASTEVTLNIAALAKVNEAILIAGRIATKSIGAVSVFVRLYRDTQ